MHSRSLHRTLRRIVLTSLATPLFAPLVACGARTDALDYAGPNAGDAGTITDTGTKTDAATITDAAIGHDGAIPFDAHVDPPPPVCDSVNKPPNGQGGGCGFVLSLVSTSAACGFPNGGEGSVELCTRLCNANIPCFLEADVSGQSTSYVECGMGCVGRKPAGLRFTGPTTGSDLGAYFARAAQLEAASVHAFRTLRDELEAHGAPARLLRAAERAERDEVRHTRVTSALARRFGGKPLAPQVEPPKTRSLEEIARENAVEGCVRETYGALLGTWQALVAEDPVVRAAMRRIAIDETRHAALAWDVAAWANERLDPEARERIEAARAEEASRLRAELSMEPAPDLVRLGGIPSAARARSLVDAMNRALAA